MSLPHFRRNHKYLLRPDSMSLWNETIWAAHFIVSQCFQRLEEVHRNTPTELFWRLFSIYSEDSKSPLIPLQTSIDSRSPYAPLAPPGWSRRLASTEAEAQTGRSTKVGSPGVWREGGGSEGGRLECGRKWGPSRQLLQVCRLRLGRQAPDVACTLKSKLSRHWARRQAKLCQESAMGNWLPTRLCHVDSLWHWSGNFFY